MRNRYWILPLYAVANGRRQLLAHVAIILLSSVLLLHRLPRLQRWSTCITETST